MSKNKTNEKATSQKSKRNWNGTIGVLQMFVVVSIVFMVVMIWMGTDGYGAKVMTVPAGLYAVILLFCKFTK